MKKEWKSLSLLLAMLLSAQTVLPVCATEAELNIEQVVSETVAEEAAQIEAASEDPEAIDTVEETPEEEIPEETEAPLPEYLKVPLYFQTDYPNTLYGAGTIATSGCSVTALAMVATYMTGHEYLPDELAYYFGGSAENNMQRLENGSKALQLPFRKASNWHDTLNALHDGKIAIVLTEWDSLFTTTQHFIVLAGINEDGKIMVHDPNEENYSKWDLKNGFVYGFDEYEILQGYSGAWIYDKEAMPEEPFIYWEERPDPANARYPHIELTLEEKGLLARMIWVEARGESDEGQQAVAEVVLNRIASESFPDTLRDVIYAEGQFRSLPYLQDAEPYQAQYDAIEKAMYGPYILPEDVVHFATYKTTDNFWGQIGGHYFCYDWDYSEE